MIIRTIPAAAFLYLLLASPSQAGFNEGKAAEQGFTQARHNLGVLYANGRGVKREEIQAYKWFAIAAANGHKKAVRSRDLVGARLTPDDPGLSGVTAGESDEKRVNRT
jgi:TPR repeat protein